MTYRGFGSLRPWPAVTTAALAALLAPASLQANEAGALIVANQTGFQVQGGTTIERAYSLDFPPPPGKFRHYLDFLADRLGFIPDYQNPALYPIVTLLDAGLDSGDPTAPELEEFYERGNPANPSRYVFSFDHVWRTPEVPSPSDTFATRFADSITTQGSRDRFCILNVNNQQHGSGTAIAIVGHPRTDASGNIVEDDPSPLPPGYTLPHDSTLDPVSDTTGHRRGQGTCPFGRVACAGVGTILLNWPEGMCTGQGTDPFRPEDLVRIVGEIHRRVYWTDHGPADFVTHPFRPEHEAVPTSQTVLTNNSIGILPMTPVSSPPGGTDTGYGAFYYDEVARMYDRLTRDSRPRAWFPDDGGRCQTLFLVATGNDRPQMPLEVKRQEDAIWNPGLAKNVLTVGVSESWNDIPGEPFGNPENGNGGSAQNLWINGTGSRSGTPRFIDARIKPDVVVPAAGVWNRLLAVPRPPPQVSDPARYSTGSGSSGAPANVSGVSQLCTVFLKHYYNRPAASPALLKAYIVNTATMLTGANTGKFDPANPASADIPAPIPNPYQGFGRVNLDLALEKRARLLVDQEVVFSTDPASPDRVLYNGYIDDPSRPVRVTLAWTDAVTDEERPRWQELVNNLDLLVRVLPPSGPIRFYHGNNFNTSGDMQHSRPHSYPAGTLLDPDDPWSYTTGGTPGDLAANGLKDNANNLECVFLPPNLPPGTRLQISVRCASLQADALDPFAESPAPQKRQDFALVGYNIIDAGDTRFTAATDWMLFQ